MVSILATNALGIDRTYFAAELGLVEPKWITQVRHLIIRIETSLITTFIYIESHLTTTPIYN